MVLPPAFAIAALLLLRGSGVEATPTRKHAKLLRSKGYKAAGFDLYGPAGPAGPAYDDVDEDDVGTHGACDAADKIVVIGGGLAGLAAARDLLRAGHADVTLLEALPHLGGRARSVNVTDGDDTWPGITYGAHWLLGSDADEGAAAEYARLAGVEGDFQASWYRENWADLVPRGAGRFPADPYLLDLDDNDYYYDADGGGANYTPRDAVMMEVRDRAKEAWNWKRDTGEVQPRAADASWRKAFALDAERAVPFNAAGKAGLINSIQENDFGAPSALWRDGTYRKRNMWAGNPWEGVAYTADWNLRHGWTPIYDWLERDILARGGVIRKNTRVVRVKRLTNHVQLKVKTADGDCEVLHTGCVPGAPHYDEQGDVCANDDQDDEAYCNYRFGPGACVVGCRPKDDVVEFLRADRVVSTASLGVLKKSLQGKGLRFQPALPPSHQEAIANLGMGFLEKIYLFFPTMFWQRTQLYADEGDEGLYYLAHVPPSYGPNDVKFTGILFHIEQSSCQFWFSGDDAIRLMKGVRFGTRKFEELKTNITDMALEAVRDIFDKDARFLDTDGNKIEVEEPMRNLTVMSNWISDPFYRGAYAYLSKRCSGRNTYWSPNNDTLELDRLPASQRDFDAKRYGDFAGYSKDRLALGAPATEGPWAGVLFFAGEATSLSVPALVHGAIESGRRAALEVAERSCGGPQEVAVPYFETKEASREYPEYEPYDEVDEAFLEGYEYFGFSDKEKYERVGCTAYENDIWFERAEELNADDFTSALDALNYLQDDDDDYDYELGVRVWVGDYNCYINHYNAFDWDELGEFVIDQLVTLGYSQELWDSDATDDSDPDKPYNKYWQDLKLTERTAADELCYTQYVWDNWEEEEGCLDSKSSKRR